jgi:hypothetical protein
VDLPSRCQQRYRKTCINNIHETIACAVALTSLVCGVLPAIGRNSVGQTRPVSPSAELPLPTEIGPGEERL